MVDGYCVKCKAKKTNIKDPVMSKTSKGGFIAKGKCPDCGTTVCRIMGKDAAEAAMASGEVKKGF